MLSPQAPDADGKAQLCSTGEDATVRTVSPGTAETNASTGIDILRSDGDNTNGGPTRRRAH